GQPLPRAGNGVIDPTMHGAAQRLRIADGHGVDVIVGGGGAVSPVGPRDHERSRRAEREPRPKLGPGQPIIVDQQLVLSPGRKRGEGGGNEEEYGDGAYAPHASEQVGSRE